MAEVIYNSPNRLKVGRGLPVRVNLSFGVEKPTATSREREKVARILARELRPDLLMDLSVHKTAPEPWVHIRNIFDGPIGILPHYLLFSDTHGLCEDSLLERIKSVTSSGINFITVHCSPTHQLMELARQKRKTPVTSRGGSIVIRDMLINRRSENIYSKMFDEICDVAQQTGTVVNLGTAFRSASVADGLDEVVKEELIIQTEYIDRARSKGIQIVLEGPGHIPLGQLTEYWQLIEPLNVSPMPLGPIVTDRFPVGDHISSSINVAYLMSLSQGGIINAITAVEHQGGVPSFHHTFAGLQAALIAAQAASLNYCQDAFHEEQVIADRRADRQSCVLDSASAGCTRCEKICPLIHSNYPSG
ncbi:hypothetical protein CCR97_06370 [Rhodoplanes elegans]|uniref:Phosphomethylpyrimidine synthase n=1 Tax=Rhodoplanes elegans TaxID=29408 RepID=A0A327KQ00_9BRAD|nr:phosphomethylpyrimidine synthase ThiC [Rhodoplanes elegans]MBK5957833.1 hypothetical protein [Rhodoplanes elegans]RAI40054.1 hypothetical protein CH338_07445 [Rhodoplanes elegans]